MNANPLATVMVTVRERNSCSGIIGCATTCSARTNPARARTATVNAAITAGSVNPCEPASIAPKVRPLMASTPVICPVTSNGTTRGREGRVRASSSSAMAPAGTLRKKISRQSIRVSTPPSTGPDEDATEPPIAQTPIARPLAFGSGNAWRMRAIEAGIIAAAAAPCTNRAATRNPSAGARPHATDARIKTARPDPKARLAPSRSDSEPAVSSSAANMSV